MPKRSGPRALIGHKKAEPSGPCLFFLSANGTISWFRLSRFARASARVSLFFVFFLLAFLLLGLFFIYLLLSWGVRTVPGVLPLQPVWGARTAPGF